MEKSQTRKTNRNSKCLKVDRAIILFETNSKFAPRPAMNIVNPETNNKINMYVVWQKSNETDFL